MNPSVVVLPVVSMMLGVILGSAITLMVMERYDG